RARRSDGDGALDRRAGAVPGSRGGGAHPVDAGGPENPWHDGEVRVAGGGPAGPDRHGVPAAKASLPEPAGNTQSRRPAARDGPGCAAWLRPAPRALLRPAEGRAAARPITLSRARRPGLDRPGPDAAPERDGAGRAVRARGLKHVPCTTT